MGSTRISDTILAQVECFHSLNELDTLAYFLAALISHHIALEVKVSDYSLLIEQEDLFQTLIAFYGQLRVI